MIVYIYPQPLLDVTMPLELFGQKLLLEARCCRTALFPVDILLHSLQPSALKHGRHDFLKLYNSSLPELGIQTRSLDSFSVFVLRGTTSCNATDQYFGELFWSGLCF